MSFDSLTKQTDLSHLEIIVVEDGSSVTCTHIIENIVRYSISPYYYKGKSDR